MSTSFSFFCCPHCLNVIVEEACGFACSSCDSFYPKDDSGSIDLRLKREKNILMPFKLGRVESVSDVPCPESLDVCRHVEVDFEGIEIPHHLTAEMLSYFPKAQSDGALALDLGCGTTPHRDAIERTGHDYVGIDYSRPGAPIWADAHALPFANDSIDFVLSVAVLEHIQYPFVMMSEVFRVLKPGSLLIGSVAFMEPFHGGSFYHHTSRGTANTLNNAGFEIVKLAASGDWNVFTANARMSKKALFPKMSSGMAEFIVKSPGFLSKYWWALISSLRKDILRESYAERVSGAFIFIAKKPSSRGFNSLSHSSPSTE